jgi:hypothetical protein
LKMWIVFGSMDSFTMLILPIQNMEDLSIFCSLLQFLSPLACSFPFRSLSSPLLSLFLGTWFFFWGYYKWNCFPIFFLSLFIGGI